MSDIVQVPYVLPTLGRIRVNFFDEACQLYSIFKTDEIRRLKKLKQLGELEKIHSGAHHTRWEYIMLQIYLAGIFKQACPGLGLSKKVESLNLGSGLEALQMYALLQNCGHLYGSFETERLVLRACVEDASIRRRMISLLPEQFRDWGDNIVENEEVFQFYKLLSIVFWRKVDTFRKEKKFNRRCLDILYAFYVEGDSQIQTLKEKSRSIRAIAYLCLDMQYAPIGVNLNLPSILFSAQEFGHRIFDNAGSEFRKLTSHIEEYLSDVVYESPSARWVFLEFQRIVFPKLMAKMKQFVKKSDFFHYLHQLRENTPQYTPRERPIYTKLGLSRQFIRRKNVKLITESRQCCDRLGVSYDQIALKVTALPYSLVAYVYHPPEQVKATSEVARRLYLLCNEIAKITESNVKLFRTSSMRSIYRMRRFSESVESIFRTVLYLLTGDSYEIVLETAGIPADLQAVCLLSKPLAIRQVTTILNHSTFKELPKDRKAELDCIKQTIEMNYGGIVALCLSNIKVLRKNKLLGKKENLIVAEIDGAVLICNKRHTKLLVIESKDRISKSVTKAKQQLKSLFSKRVKLLKPFETCVEEITDIPNKGAFLPIRLSR